MEEKSCRRDHGGETTVEKSYKRTNGGEIVEDK